MQKDAYRGELGAALARVTALEARSLECTACRARRRRWAIASKIVATFIIVLALAAVSFLVFMAIALQSFPPIGAG